VCLDTHIVVWLYAGLANKLSETAKETIDGCNVSIAQIVRLELQYLNEIGRITARPATIINSLSKSIDLRVSDWPLSSIIDEALKIRWTRDIFDRLLVGEARARAGGLITADKEIRKHFRHAIW